MIIKNKLFRLVLFGAGIAIGAVGRGCLDDWYGRNVEHNKTSSVEETAQAVKKYCTTFISEKTALENKLTQKIQDYNTCTTEKSKLQQQFEAASQVSDSRYLTFKGIVESSKSDADKSVELGTIVDSYLLNVGAIEVRGSTCSEGLGSLYSIVVSVNDDKIKSEFVRVLGESNPCGEISPNSSYINFEYKK